MTSRRQGDTDIFTNGTLRYMARSARESDAEAIEFVSSFFKRLGLKVTIEVNNRRLIEQYIKTKSSEYQKMKQVLEMFRAVDKVPKKGAEAVLQEYSKKIDPVEIKNAH